MATTSADKKALGAYYTDEALVSFLVRWALEGLEGDSRVMDPSCGDGRFLQDAAKNGAKDLVGCDLDPDALAATRSNLKSVGCRVKLIDSDFFAIEPASFKPVDVVIGNPPYIRYQRFSGETREQALRSAKRMGVSLTRLTSSWAPFLLHAAQFLREGGTLAMVVPAELIQTQYGISTLQALCSAFSDVTLLTFECNLFEDAQEETFLLLASDREGQADSVRLIPLKDGDDLTNLELTEPELGSKMPIGKAADVRFIEAFLAAEERKSWQVVKEHPLVRQIDDLGTLANGYVSGANDFFHRTRGEACAAGFPEEWLVPAARQSRSLRGLFFTKSDIEALEETGLGHHLILPEGEGLFNQHPEALEKFQQEGKEAGIDERYKCRNREPWWFVPGTLEADVLLTYMAGSHPKAAVNQAEAVYTNTLHGVRMAEENDPLLMALSFHSSLTLLSLEIEGRSYGGGILKVEPREMGKVRVAWPELPSSALEGLAGEVDQLVRDDAYTEATRLIDQALLIDGLGLASDFIEKLDEGRQRLLGRRTERGRGKRDGSS